MEYLEDYFMSGNRYYGRVNLPHCEDGYTIRTPRREGGFAAQVWVDAGCWVVGKYASREAAREAARGFAASEPVAPRANTKRCDCPVNWYWRRSDRHTSSRPFIREVKAGAWQARPWLGKRGGSLNLGLFTLAENNNSREEAEWAAARVSKEFTAKLWRKGVTVEEAVAVLKAKGWVREDLVVPRRQRKLKPSMSNGPQELASERRGRLARVEERRKYGGVSLLSFTKVRKESGAMLAG